MSSIGRTAGFCCCRRSPTLQACRSPPGRAVWGAAPQTALATMSSSSSLAVVKSLSSWLANSGLSKVAGKSRGGFSRAPVNLCAVVAGRAYQTEGGPSWHGRSSTTTTAAQGAYEQYGQQQDRGELPRPPMIAWEKDLANAVQLIGTVGRDIEIKYLASGKVVARSTIAVRKGVQRDEEKSWFEIEIWDALAEIAAHHIKKGEQIFVTGRIVVDKWVKDDVWHTVAKVVVRDLCFVEPYNSQRQPYGQPTVVQQEEYIEMGSNNRSEEVTSMGSPKQSWNQQRSPNPSQGTIVQNGSSRSYDEAALAVEKRWQDYFADPSQWWDNRNRKKNPKAPDFKHKSTQEALWLDGWNNPPWVSQQMKVLEERQAQHAGDFVDFRPRLQDKKLSSFRDSDFMY